MTMVKVNNPLGKSFDGLVNDLFNDFPAGFSKAVRQDIFQFPPVNISEKNESYELQLSAPGMVKADFAIKLEDKMLTISAEKKSETANENEKLIRKEFSRKSFKRSFTLDEKIDAAGINAKYENGILLVTLPKKEVVKPSAQDIQVL